MQILPPVAARIPHLEIRHGEQVIDEFFWVREKSNPRVIEYLEAENAWTAQSTADLVPFQRKLYEEMLGRIQQTDLSVPTRRGAYLYYTRIEEGKQYPIHCRREGSMESPEQVLLDFNELSAGKAFASLGTFVLSDDQKLLAYTVDFIGYRQYALQVKDLQTSQLLPDTAERVTSVAWAADNQTLFFTTEDEVTKRSDKLFRQLLGASPAELIYEEADELFNIGVGKTRDKRYLVVLSEAKDTTEALYLAADDSSGAFRVFLPREKGHRYYPDHRDDLFYIRTNKLGEDFAVVTAPEADLSAANWKTFIAHQAGVRIEEIDVFRSFAVSTEKTEALERLRVYDFAEQSWRSVSFSEPVYSVHPGSTPDFEATQFRYNYESFVTPPSVFDYDPATGQSKLLKQQEVLGGYDPGRYVSERLWATARDGTRVPISIVHLKDQPRDGSQALLLYGYGSYGFGLSAGFSSSRFSLIDRGMSYAIAHIRGGNEMGEQWRLDGMLMKKKNTFFDFIDCAEFLISEKWTSKNALVIEGGSAGGLLMGAVANLRPDLFRAVHMAVPFVDVMNTMLDATLPLTVAEYLEWGDPNEKSAYDYMRSYSPYDNLAKQDYPAILVTSSLHDSQVMYWEPAKYVARLRTLKTDSNQLLLKMKTKPSGHGGASGRYDRLEDQAFEYAWMLSQVGILA